MFHDNHIHIDVAIWYWPFVWHLAPMDSCRKDRRYRRHQCPSGPIRNDDCPDQNHQRHVISDINIVLTLKSILIMIIITSLEMLLQLSFSFFTLSLSMSESHSSPRPSYVIVIVLMYFPSPYQCRVDACLRWMGSCRKCLLLSPKCWSRLSWLSLWWQGCCWRQRKWSQGGIIW